ncbi:MAG TPA: hypothetical protein VHX63_09325 [Acidobacteriaceae bacterium]|jgi:hypothetical protein|nr:hypothetical protein [Acidobacteriaceae bacterium]
MDIPGSHISGTYISGSCISGSWILLIFLSTTTVLILLVLHLTNLGLLIHQRMPDRSVEETPNA